MWIAATSSSMTVSVRTTADADWRALGTTYGV